MVTEFTMPGVERVHSAAVEDVWQNFGTCPRVGLTDTEARRRLARFGPNLIATKEKAGKLALLLNQFTSPSSTCSQRRVPSRSILAIGRKR